MTRYAIALLVAVLVHTAAFWGWNAFRNSHPDHTVLPTIDLSSVELSFSDDVESEAVHAAEVQSNPPAEPQTTPAVPPTSVPPPPEAESRHSTTLPVEAPPDVLMSPAGLPIPVASPPPTPPKVLQKTPRLDTAEPEKTAPAAPEPARETAHIQAPPAPPSSFRPKYPTGSRKRGEEGIVSLEIAVNALGRATGVQILTSSGFPDLDAAAVEAAKKARFTPATEDGQPVPGRIRLPVEFRLR